MDWSWLTNIFQTIWSIIKKIVHLKWSDLWKALQTLVQHLRSWYRWYQVNVQAQIQAARQRFRLLYDRFIFPVIRVIDTIRRITQLVGLFNKRLAAKLNLVFLRIEAKLLLPLNLYNQRLNVLSRMMSGFLTQLGYLDRATLLNSLWRDAKYLRVLATNPLAGSLSAAPTPPLVPLSQRVQAAKDYLNGIATSFSASVDASVATAKNFMENGVDPINE